MQAKLYVIASVYVFSFGIEVLLRHAGVRVFSPRNLCEAVLSVFCVLKTDFSMKCLQVGA